MYSLTRKESQPEASNINYYSFHKYFLGPKNAKRKEMLIPWNFFSVWALQMANLRNAIVLFLLTCVKRHFLSTCQVFFLPDSFLWSVHLRLNYKLNSAVNWGAYSAKIIYRLFSEGRGIHPCWGDEAGNSFWPQNRFCPDLPGRPTGELSDGAEFTAWGLVFTIALSSITGRLSYPGVNFMVICLKINRIKLEN